MTTTPQEVGVILRQAREHLNYSLLDLSETCGLTEDEIVAVEDGTTEASDHATRIAMSIGVRLE